MSSSNIVNIENILNHKMFCSKQDQENRMNEKLGVVGLAIDSYEYDFISVIKRVSEIDFCIYGNQSEFDNIVCNGQKVQLEQNLFVKKLAIIGFNEFGNYKDIIQLQHNNHDIIKKTIHFYQFMENIEAIYSCDKSDFCQLAFQCLGNGFMPINYYINIIDVNLEIDSIILPDSEELHIAGISIVY